MIKGKVLFISLLATNIIGAVLLIAQLWFDVMSTSNFIKSLVTLGITGTLFSLLVAFNYDMQSSRGKTLLGISILLAIILSALIIGQMWWSVFEVSLFIKLLITNLILLVLVSVVMAIKEDLGNNKTLRDENFID